MKKFPFIIVTVMAVLLSASCVSSKKIVYFQGADSLYQTAQQITQQFDMRIKPADNIMIKVSCSNPELLTVFANNTLMGQVGQSQSLSTGTTGSINSAYGFTVNRDGDVILPLLDHVHVGGLTTEEAARLIEKKIIEAQLVNDPEVTVNLMNARVAVLGAVGKPGVVSLTSERNTIVEVLAQSGDIADDGLKRNIKLFREVNGVRTMYTLDLTSVDVFKSPAFYVQQNDMIYVQPNKSKNVKNSSFYTFLSAGASLLGIVSTVLSIVVIATKL